MKALKIGDARPPPSGCRTMGFRAVDRPDVNHLTIDATIPSGTQETKACLVNVVKASRQARRSGSPRGRA
jgi:hypothetical protein